MKTKELLHNVFSKIGKIPKSQRNFLISIITCLYSMRGRANFTNISRYMSYNECTIRRNFSKSFVFVEFNKTLVLRQVKNVNYKNHEVLYFNFKKVSNFVKILLT